MNPLPENIAPGVACMARDLITWREKLKKVLALYNDVKRNRCCIGLQIYLVIFPFLPTCTRVSVQRHLSAPRPETQDDHDVALEELEYLQNVWCCFKIIFSSHFLTKILRILGVG